MDFGQLLATIGLSSAIAIGTAWAGFKYFAGAWLKARFDRALEGFRSEKARELEALKFETSRLLDRATKIHQREIEVLPTLWDKMTAALSATSHLTNRSQLLPQTEYMGTAQLGAFIKDLDLPDWEKDELRGLEGTERDKNLWQKLRWQGLRRARELHGDFHNYFIANSVFLPVDLRTEIRRLSNLNYDALQEFLFYLEGQTEPGPDGFKMRDLFAAEWEPGFEGVLKIVQGHLWVAGDAGTDLLDQRDKIIEGAQPKQIP